MPNYTTHCFSVELATSIGLREAIIVQHLYWWHQHNAGIPAMNIGGLVWFHLSNAQIVDVFPYLSTKAVRGIMDKLIDGGYLVKDHKGEGKDKMNRTNWYALTESALGLFHLPQGANATAHQGNIVNNKSYYTSPNGESNNIYTPPTPGKKFDFRQALLGLGVTPEVADAWMQVRKAKKAVNTQIAFNAIAKEIAKAGCPADDCIRLAVVKSWCGFKAEWMENQQPQHQQFTRKHAATGTSRAVDNMLALGREMFGEQINPVYDEQ